mmetsp:Transcript_29763/g.41099  ORF Transcript_29763/g.41099 Transcript_29763/m.41099 type:complete len:217 (-) Transcript_29763:103-753(-)|eukprot:CAMPEP_0196578158 /NCGR_PEP_ID=MMETSP1081-20130531/7112_1 /TAXON_ID=36882 /ORGANISM="Pyramimonas amylifera, Strain CCMP720" /LENGTH=216 /DNA_ID=CAMNT_0041897283 /DNA_START=157 /DNA_END=807 /DNA_ORIENTATION=+
MNAGNHNTSEVFQNEPQNKNRVLWVGDLGYEVTTQILFQAFSQFGEVTRACVATDPLTRGKESHLLGYGFVEFAEPEHAKHVLEVCGSRSFFYIGGSPRPVVVEFAETPAERASRVPGMALDEPTPQYQGTDDTGYKLVAFSELSPLERKYAQKLKGLLSNHQVEEDLLQKRHLEEQQALFHKHKQAINADLEKLSKIEEIKSVLKNLPLTPKYER